MQHELLTDIQAVLQNPQTHISPDGEIRLNPHLLDTLLTFLREILYRSTGDLAMDVPSSPYEEPSKRLKKEDINLLREIYTALRDMSLYSPFADVWHKAGKNERIQETYTLLTLLLARNAQRGLNEISASSIRNAAVPPEERPAQTYEYVKKKAPQHFPRPHRT